VLAGEKLQGDEARNQHLQGLSWADLKQKRTLKLKQYLFNADQKWKSRKQSSVQRETNSSKQDLNKKSN
jgi:hypothetical protein